MQKATRAHLVMLQDFLTSNFSCFQKKYYCNQGQSKKKTEKGIVAQPKNQKASSEEPSSDFQLRNKLKENVFPFQSLQQVFAKSSLCTSSKIANEMKMYSLAMPIYLSTKIIKISQEAAKFYKIDSLKMVLNIFKTAFYPQRKVERSYTFGEDLILFALLFAKEFPDIAIQLQEQLQNKGSLKKLFQDQTLIQQREEKTPLSSISSQQSQFMKQSDYYYEQSHLTQGDHKINNQVSELSLFEFEEENQPQYHNPIPSFFKNESSSQQSQNTLEINTSLISRNCQVNSYSNSNDINKQYHQSHVELIKYSSSYHQEYNVISNNGILIMSQQEDVCKKLNLQHSIPSSVNINTNQTVDTKHTNLSYPHAIDSQQSQFYFKTTQKSDSCQISILTSNLSIPTIDGHNIITNQVYENEIDYSYINECISTDYTHDFQNFGQYNNYYSSSSSFSDVNQYENSNVDDISFDDFISSEKNDIMKQQ